jgi:ABC-2 type transport system ATP-binding protein
VTAGYGRSRILQGVSFSISNPGIYVVLGPNGAGKTTLFRTLAGILRPYDGSVSLDGVPIHETTARNRMHYLSHVDGIPDALRVEEALAFYAKVEGATEEDIRRVERELDLASLRGKFFSDLSAGQKKRVSVARIFLQERDIYLLDEPTANVDPKIASEIRAMVQRLARDKIVLYSSHNLFEAREIGEYVLAIKGGKVALFDRISNLRTVRYSVGIRVVAGADRLPPAQKSGDYFVFDLSGAQEVPSLLRDLLARGVDVSEVKELGNPLEDLFQ